MSDSGNSHNGQVRVPLAVSLLVSLLGAAVTGAGTWATYSERLNQHERTIQEQNRSITSLQQLSLANDRQIAVIATQYGEILRRLEKIDRKLEAQP